MSNFASTRSRSSVFQLTLTQLHPGQVAALRALQPYRFKVLRCGRRFGKTDLAKAWIADGLIRGWECAWLAPQHRTWSEDHQLMRDFALLTPAQHVVEILAGIDDTMQISIAGGRLGKTAVIVGDEARQECIGLL
jgi:hypothetical protein